MRGRAPPAEDGETVGIIGGGETGVRAGLALRDAGWTGPIWIASRERHPPYERPPLSKAVMLDPQATPPAVTGAGQLSAHGIALLAGTDVSAIDRAAHEAVLRDGRRLPFSRLLIATGARPRELLLPGAENALLLRTLDDAVALRTRLHASERVVIVGGGFIGLELAASASSRGCAVTVIEAAPRLLARAVPEAIAAIVARWHLEHGVTLLTGTGIDRLEPAGDQTIVHLADGRALAAELVVAGVGAVPETQLAEEAGLAVENGIVVDASLRTSDPAIFAAGDCASFPHPLFGDRPVRLESWRNARDQGVFVARSMLGHPEPFGAVPWFWSDQYDMTLQVAGIPSAGTSIVERSPGEGALLTFHLDAEGRLVGAAGAGSLAKVARDIRVAELLIERRSRPDPARLADPSAVMKGLLRT